LILILSVEGIFPSGRITFITAILVLYEDILKYMKAALYEAELAYNSGEIPIGAVVVKDGRIIGRGHNRSEALKDPTAHAEIISITAASNSVDDKYLDDCSIFITVEPCIMCAGAILLSRIKNLYFGAFEPKYGACGSLHNLIENNVYNRKINVISGIMEEECGNLLKKFFVERRTTDQE